jgi:hypothetical protein
MQKPEETRIWSEEETRIWSEEEMDYLDPEPPPARARRTGLAGRLRGQVLEQNRHRAAARPHELTRASQPAIIFSPQNDASQATHGNFIDASYRRIVADPAWRARLEKAHTAKRQARPAGPDEAIRCWRELDTATSSDALLMNIFCYPGVLARGKLPALLGIERGIRPEFGYRPALEVTGSLPDRTEIDMRLGTLLIEAKLTETGFQTAPLRLVERYPQFANVFDPAELAISRRGVESYQLLRGVLAAQAEGSSFCVLVDSRRADLIEAWHSVLRAVRSFDLRTRLRLYTWQEIAVCVPLPLRRFLAGKYGIAAGA